MSEPKHTPGPWVFADSKLLRTKTSLNDRGGMDGGIFVGQFHAAPNEADARLITAAPDMRDTLERVESFLSSEKMSRWDYMESERFYEDKDAALKDVRAAIAKAEGRQP